MMAKMNSNGQTLVLFVVIMPILSIMFIFLFQLGSINLDKKKVTDTIKEALNYGVNNLDSELLVTNVKNMIISNDKEILEENIFVTIEDSGLSIKVIKEYDKMLISDKIVFNYTGKLVGNKLEVIENRG